MKKILRIAGFILLGLLVFVALFVAIVLVKGGNPTYAVNIPDRYSDYQVRSDSSIIALGGKLAALTCANCHLGEDGRLSGAQMVDVPKEFGWIHSANITQHPTSGIGEWTDSELIYLLRTSVKRDGAFTPPYMPAFPRMADSDIEAIVAWLRSDDPLVQPSEVIAPDPKPSFLVKFLNVVAFAPFTFPEQEITVPDSSDEVSLGRYIANDIVGCYSCHSDDFQTVNEVTPELSVDFYAGGNPLLNKAGEVIASSNITMDVTGIGHYTRGDFINAVRWGKRPDGTLMQYPMLPMTILSDREVGAIYEYLKTVPKISKVIESD